MMSASFNLHDDVAVVTGAAGRLGPIWMAALMEAGARVAGIDRAGVQPPDALRALIDRFGPDRISLDVCDITDRRQLDACAEHIEDACGPVTVLVNNAGVDQPPDDRAPRYSIEQHPIALMCRMLDVNVMGTFQATQVFGGRMARAGRGVVINIGSLYASVSPDHRLYAHVPGDPPFLKSPAYGASKAAVNHLTKYFAGLWGCHGIRVNTLSPGGVVGGQDREFKRKYAERVPLGRMASPEDLGGPLVFLASSASSYVTGAELLVDGGFTVW